MTEFIGIMNRFLNLRNRIKENFCVVVQVFYSKFKMQRMVKSMRNEVGLEQEEQKKYRSPDIARIIFSVIAFILSREIEVVNTLMSFHLFIFFLDNNQ